MSFADQFKDVTVGSLTKKIKAKRISYYFCEKCGGGIKSLSLYSGKCQRCRDAEKRIKRLKSGETISRNEKQLVNKILRSLR